MIAAENANADNLPRDREALLALLGAQPEDAADTPVQQLADEDAIAAFTIGAEDCSLGPGRRSPARPV